jgi:hypothetical protein
MAFYHRIGDFLLEICRLLREIGGRENHQLHEMAKEKNSKSALVSR